MRAISQRKGAHAEAGKADPHEAERGRGQQRAAHAQAVHEIRTPARLKALNVTLMAKVRNVTTGKEVELSASKSFSINGIDPTDKIEDLHLARFGAGYVIELLGRTGEAKPDRPVHLSFKHRDFKTPITVSLKSDVNGRVTLGQLTDIATVTASIGFSVAGS